MTNLNPRNPLKEKTPILYNKLKMIGPVACNIKHVMAVINSVPQ
jgi:hypothetical protein